MIGWIVVICSALLILICAFILFLNPIKTWIEKNKFQKSVYRILHYYAEEEDQLLLNNVNLVFDKNAQEPYVFDHMLFADKYIYIISDYTKIGGLYGNINDQFLFLKDEKNQINKIFNPVILNENKITELERVFAIPHSDKMFVSVVVFNPSLVVPKELLKKEQTSWFLSLDELEKTIKKAEMDDVTPITHAQSEDMAKSILARSDRTKKEALAREKNFRRN